MYEICWDPAYRKLVALWSHLQTTDDINDRIPLSFHAVSFGPERCSDVLRRIVDIAQEVENSVSHNSLIIKSVPSSFAKASVFVYRYLCSPRGEGARVALLSEKGGGGWRRAREAEKVGQRG